MNTESRKLMLAVFVLELYAFLGMSNNLRPEWMMQFTIFGWPLLTFLFILAMMAFSCRNGEDERV